MDLSGLPQFTVDEIRVTSGGPEVTIVGRLSHVRGVRNDTAWLYRSWHQSLIGSVNQLPTSSNDVVEFRTADLHVAPEIRVGTTYPWIDGYWQAYHVGMVLAGEWEARHFTSTPARYFRLAGVAGWQPVDAPLMEGAEDLGVRGGAWDHEHCELCRERIGAGGNSKGYVDPEDHWLCERCHHRYGVPRDISFAAEA